MRKNYRIPIFCFITSLYWFSLYTYVPILSTYAASIGANYKMIGLIVGSYGFTQMILRIPLGIFSDMINKRKIFVILGLILSIISSVGMWFFEGVIPLLIFRGLSGAAAAAWVTYTVLFSSYFDGSDAPKAIGILNSFNSLGQVVAMLLAGIIAQKFGAKYTFLLSLIGGIIGLLMSLCIFENKDIKREPVKLSTLIEVGSNTTLLVVSLLAVIIQLLTFATVYGFTPIAAKKIGASNFELSLLSTFSVLPGIFASALSGTFFARKIGEYNTVVIGFIIISLSCFPIPFIYNINVLYITQLIGGFGRGLAYPLLMGLSIKNISSIKRATAMGFFQAIYGIGMFLGPVIFGYLSDAAGLAVGFVTVGAIGFIGAFIAWYYSFKLSLK